MNINIALILFFYSPLIATWPPRGWDPVAREFKMQCVGGTVPWLRDTCPNVMPILFLIFPNWQNNWRSPDWLMVWFLEIRDLEIFYKFCDRQKLTCLKQILVQLRIRLFCVGQISKNMDGFSRICQDLRWVPVRLNSEDFRNFHFKPKLSFLIENHKNDY